MKDSEVGELWSLCNSTDDTNIGLLGDMKRLIRKLVDERRKYNTLAHKDGSPSRTIHDFGIDEKEWPG